MKIEDFNDILYEKEDNGLCTITLNIPKRKNAMSKVTFLEIKTALKDMEQDKNATVLIVTGCKEANAFSSGDFFANLADIAPEIKSEIDLSDVTQKSLSLQFWDFPKPVVFAINGLAIGSAISMCLLGADLIFMSEDAWIGFYYVRNAVLPIFGTHFTLPFLIGFQKAKELMYLGDKITANDAEKLGLVNKVLPPNELIPFSREQALRLIPPKGPSVSIKLMKKTMHAYFRDILVRTLDLENENNRSVTQTHDFREATRAFVTKRLPKFRGK
jgi:2-(1,2-epoxy-1,2-dihydrophenyl)acetyl-CoA isomerase